MHPALRTAAVLAGLAGINVAAQRSRLSADLVVPAGALALLAGARASGLTWEELGLGRRYARRGLVVALGAASAIVAGVAVAASHPAAAPFRVDDRYPTARDARRGALVRIPLAVAVPEEILFRSVLDASLRWHLSDPAATSASAAAFGAWHALGAMSLAESNAGLGGALDETRFRTAVGVAGTVIATGLAGIGFTALRRTGSVLPPIAAHWALNASAAIASRPRAAEARG